MTIEYLKCEDCGKQDATVRKTICPYEQDINDRIVEVILCPECEHERVMDI